MVQRAKIIAAAGLLALLTPEGLAQMALPDENNRDTRPQTQPQSRQQAQPERPSRPEPVVSFGVFSEPIELTTLIDYVGSSLNINIVVKGSPAGEIVFNAPVQVPQSRLIGLLDAMLEQYNFTITHDPASGFYIVQPLDQVKPMFSDELASTRIIPTPNIKPSLLVPTLTSSLRGGAPTQGNNAAGGAIQAIDELGVLVINAPSRDISRVEQMVEKLIDIDRKQQYIRLELDHLAAPVALDRVSALAGGAQSAGVVTNQGGNNRGRNNDNQSIPQLGSTVTLSDIPQRLTVDPQGNALFFKGDEDEIARVRQLLAVIDVPNTLSPKNYFAGASAAQIADIAKRRGLGEVILIEDTTNNINPFNNFNNNNNNSFNNTEPGRGGPVMVVDPSRGNIIYYGTEDQQAQLAALLTELKTEDERIVIEEYQLDYSDAATITDLLTGIITGESQTGDSDLLPGGTNRNQSRFINGFPVNLDGESPGEFDPDKITVIADEFNNQVVIKAPIKQQGELEKLIGRLDKQRAQVYIQAMIVSVADNEDFTLAFESQITAGEFSYGTNFGLSGRDNFLDPKAVTPGLGGFTAAVIRSDYVPIIVNATQTNTDVRILSTPQLLVNDNEESSIVSIEEQPYSEITQSDGSDNLQGLGGYVEAGTTLTVTPSISKAGFIRMEYYVELSNFVGTGSGNLPPPTNRRTVEGTATVPSNATIVIGGITVEDLRDTIVKVPLLGDIPIVGELFKRTNKVNNQSKLYVFLTPRIMADPNFNDLKLFSRGPQSEMDIEDGIPDLEPALIIGPVGASQDEPDAPATQRQPGVSTNQDRDSAAPATAPQLEPAYIELSSTESE